MRRFIILALAMCTLSITGYAQKKEKKEKKQKTEKTYEWNWDGTRSGNQKVDDYLMTIDTLWNKIQNYSELMDAYDFHQDTITINDQHYIAAYMTTDNGSLVTRATCTWQIVTSIGNGISIGSQAIKAGAMGASAATALPSLGLKAMSYGKYLKGAPNIISMATKEIKEVVGVQKANARIYQLRGLREVWYSLRRETQKRKVVVHPSVGGPEGAGVHQPRARLVARFLQRHPPLCRRTR